MPHNIAKHIKDLDGFAGDARLYELNPPLEDSRYVIVSAVNPFGMGDETYIFPASEDGKITNWIEMDGSFKGSLDHGKALKNAGYEIE